ncbi:two-component system response regulator [Candidatus Poribacteria bacterium]|nr:MAG: two-component system response regulator [Candidatus Poribacteria bacterium]
MIRDILEGKVIELPSKGGKRRALVGASPAFRRALELARKVAESDVTVMILGETGTGKELLARFIHFNSRRRSKPFVAVHCASIPETLLESELFGYEPGAFTGATRRKIGKFELADGGTLFLDEIGDMPLSMQVKLLRALQEREIERVGGLETIPVDVRVIAATNKNLLEEVRKGSFRNDLYYRLSTVPIYLPPLRERREDIPLLVEYFIREISEELGVEVSVSEEAMEMLMEYPWPGNVRELENVVQRAVVLQTDGVIRPEHLWLSEGNPMRLEIEAMGGEGRITDLKSAAKEAEKRAIIRALIANRWNKTKAAKQLGISYRALMYKIKEYGIRELEKQMAFND